MSAFDPVTGNYLSATSTATYAITGTSRYDMVTVTGTSTSNVKIINYNDVLEIYPNPAYSTDGFTIITDNKVFSGKTVISVYNMFGQLMSRENANEDSGEVFINSGNFTSGSYFVHLINAEGKQAVKQIIIE